MRLGSLFTGVGGIDLAFERAGFKVAWQCEIDPQARSILDRYWPDVPCHEDVRECGRHNLSPVDAIAGGFPCQDLSVAGQRGGLKGERSGLFWEMLRITDELRPRFLVWENVPGLLSSDSGRDFARIIRGLADIGYHGAWRVLDAQYFGVPQRRRRVFGVFACEHAGAERCAEILSLAAGMQGNSQAGREAGQGVAATIRGRSSRHGVSAPGRGGEDDENLVVFKPKFYMRDNAKMEGAPITDGTTMTLMTCCDEIHIAPALRASGVGTERAGDTRGQAPLIVANACIAHQAKGGDPTTDNYVIAHALRSEGADASEDGTGRGTPLVYAMQERMESFNPDAGPNGKGWSDEGVAFTLESRHRTQTVAGPLQGVRRLTPRECERLQGLPDDWTRWAADGTEIKDGPRYRMIGNGVAVPCVHWFAARMAMLMWRERFKDARAAYWRMEPVA